MRAARVTPEGLTLKEEACVQAFLSLGNETEAYRSVYAKGEPPQDWHRTEAWKFFRKERIIERLAGLIKKTEVAALYTSDVAMTEAKEAFDLARDNKNPNAMVAAVTLRSKLAGILIERRENTNKSEHLTKEELMEAAMQAAQEAGFVITKAKEDV